MNRRRACLALAAALAAPLARAQDAFAAAPSHLIDDVNAIVKHAQRDFFGAHRVTERIRAADVADHHFTVRAHRLHAVFPENGLITGSRGSAWLPDIRYRHAAQSAASSATFCG